jgi:hypothetical protein
MRVRGQSELHSKILSQNKQTKNNQKKEEEKNGRLNRKLCGILKSNRMKE